MRVLCIGERSVIRLGCGRTGLKCGFAVLGLSRSSSSVEGVSAAGLPCWGGTLGAGLQSAGTRCGHTPFSCRDRIQLSPTKQARSRLCARHAESDLREARHQGAKSEASSVPLSLSPSSQGLALALLSAPNLTPISPQCPLLGAHHVALTALEFICPLKSD